MDDKQFAAFLTANEESTKRAIEKHVNGKIKDLSAAMAIFMEKDAGYKSRIEPVLKAYEEDKAFSERLGKIGKRTINWGKVLVALGTFVVLLRYAALQLINYKP